MQMCNVNLKTAQRKEWHGDGADFKTGRFPRGRSALKQLGEFPSGLRTDREGRTKGGTASKHHILIRLGDRWQRSSRLLRCGTRRAFTQSSGVKGTWSSHFQKIRRVAKEAEANYFERGHRRNILFGAEYISLPRSFSSRRQ